MYAIRYLCFLRDRTFKYIFEPNRSNHIKNSNVVSAGLSLIDIWHNIKQRLS